MPTVRFVAAALALLLHAAVAASSIPPTAGAYDEDSLCARLDPDEREYLYGLQYLMNPFQQKQYLTLPDRPGREAWIGRFWLQHDPTPTTPVNERRIEHERRVASAREGFGIAREPGWDLRGQILIRFGEPDTRAIIPPDVSRLGASPPKEQWYYVPFDMMITFADHTHNGEYTLDEEIPFSIAAMLRVMQDDAPQTPYGKANVWIIFTQFPFETIPSLAVDLETPKETPSERIAYCHPCDIRSDRLPAFVDISSFRGGPGAVRTEVCVEVPVAQISGAGGSRVDRPCEIELRVLARNSRMDSIAFAGCTVRASEETLGRLPVEGLLPGSLSLTLEPGYYRIGIEVIDRKTGSSSSFRPNLRLDGFEMKPSLSDIQFAGRIRDDADGGPFTKGTLEVIPHPSRRYLKPAAVCAYFEIYGLDTDDRDIAFYEVEYTVHPLSRRRWGPVLLEPSGEIRSRFETSGYGSFQPTRIEIATDELHEGSHELTVRVTDRRTRMSVEKRARFHILQ